MTQATEEARKAIVIDNIEANITRDDVLKAMKVRRTPDSLLSLVDAVLQRCMEVARPKAMFTVCYVSSRTESSVTLEEETFHSKVLAQNLEGIERVFPFVATCGVEVDHVQFDGTDMMTTYCADTVRLLLVQAARRHMDKHLKSVYSLPQLSRMAPGSLQDWPLPEQAPLFRLLGDTESLIGVRLTDRHLMIPIKSVSGICFPTEVRFESCQLCQRPVCIGRRAPYNPELATRYGVGG